MPSGSAKKMPMSVSAASTREAKRRAAASTRATSAFLPTGPSRPCGANGRHREAPLPSRARCMSSRIFGSVAAKLLVAFATISIVLALLISGLEVLQEREAQGAVLANIDTLSLALWTLNDDVLNVTARSLVRAAGIVHVEILEDGQAKVKLDRTTPPRAADYSWNVPLLRPGTTQTIGTLRISENYEDLRAQLARRAGVLVVTELTKILATSILLFVVVFFLITRPLSTLAEKVQRSAGQGSGGPISVKRVLYRMRDEIDALI